MFQEFFMKPNISKWANPFSLNKRGFINEFYYEFLVVLSVKYNLIIQKISPITFKLWKFHSLAYWILTVEKCIFLVFSMCFTQPSRSMCILLLKNKIQEFSILSSLSKLHLDLWINAFKDLNAAKSIIMSFDHWGIWNTCYI